MRRFLATAACLLSLTAAAAGCGGGSSDSGKSPLDNALGYLPESAPVAVALETDLNGAQWKSLTANAEKFPFAGQVESALKDSIGQSGVDYDKDIKPLLGNELVIGLPTVQTVLGSNAQAVGALQVKDGGKLSNLLSRSNDLKRDGSSNGATLYKEKGGSTELAQEDNVLVVASTRQQLQAALEQRDRDDRLTEDEFNSNLAGLPSNALARLYVNARALINGSPASEAARKVKWVAALRTIGLTASSQSDGITLDFNAKTDPSQLSDADLPVASGDASPPVAAGAGDIAVGIRGLDQTERFAETVARAVSPASYGDFLRSKRQLSSRLGVDVDRDLIGQLSGNATVAFDAGGDYAVRAEPKDPAAFARTLERVERVAPSFAQGAGLDGARLTRVRGLYKLTGRDGRTIYYGMVGKVFAASNDLDRLAQIASESPRPVPGAKGAISINADVAKIVSDIVARAAGGGLGGAFGGSLATAPLGGLTGWIHSSTSGLTGHLKLEIK